MEVNAGGCASRVSFEVPVARSQMRFGTYYYALCPFIRADEARLGKWFK